jgi:hypothetical protein
MCCLILFAPQYARMIYFIVMAHVCFCRFVGFVFSPKHISQSAAISTTWIAISCGQNSDGFLKTGWKWAEAVIDNILRYVDVFSCLLVCACFEM